MASPWTPQKDADLTKHLAAGATYREIASALGVSRSSVGGRTARLGLKSKNDQVCGASKRAPRLPRAPAPSRPDIPRITNGTIAKLKCVEVEPRHISILELDKHTCRFPYGGDSDGSAITYCGCPPMTGRPYCGPHTARTVQPSEW